MDKFILKRSLLGHAQGMVEFALVLPLLLLLSLGIMEAGRLLFIYSATQSSSREAARYGSAAGDIGGYVAHYEDCAGIRAAAKRIGRFVGIQDASITITYDHGPGTGTFASCPPATSQVVKLGDRIAVQVAAVYRPVVPLVRWTPLTMTSVSRRTIIKDVEIEGTPPPAVTPTVSFATSEQSQDEDAGDMHVIVQLTAATNRTVTVPYSVVGTATGGGVDFTISPNPVKIMPGETTAAILIHVTPDVIDEDDETVILIMGSPTNAIKGTPDVHTATILDDDDPPLIFFSLANQSIPENLDGIIQVELSAASSRDITVSYDVGGTAQGIGVDYSITSSPITISAGSTSYPIVVDVNDDILDEDDETIVVTLTNASNATLGVPDIHTLTITDNDDPPVVSFTWPSQLGDESVGTMSVEAELSGISSKAVTIPFSVSGTATQGADYTISASPIVILPGQLTAAATIAVFADSDNTEGDETVILTMLMPTNATLGTPSVHTATISAALVVPTVYFTTASQTGDESAGNSMHIVVRLSAASTQAVTIPFTLSGTAIRGTDYTITASPVTIPAGSASANIVINVINDSVDEDDETVIVTMGTPLNAIKGTPNVHTVTITDNDGGPQVYFTTGAQNAAENAGTVTATVLLSVISGKDIAVSYMLSGSAEQGAGKDYTIAPSPVIIPAGTLSVNIPIQIIDDTQTETSEDIQITLHTPVNATIGSPDIHTVTILDNEPVCPSPDSLPFFGSGSNQNKLTWTLQSPNPLVAVNLTAVTIRWPSGAQANVTAITFIDPIYSGDALPPYLAVNTPSPLWSGAFTTRQMIYKFDKNPKQVSGDFYQVTATFEGCPPISGIIPSD